MPAGEAELAEQWIDRDWKNFKTEVFGLCAVKHKK
jgi:hypothetical protein